MKEKALLYAQLMRLDRPIGIYLLLWPTLWALWFAADGIPHLANFLIFTFGVILMRSAGCVINDYADRNLDRHVERTRYRPLTTGRVSEAEAIGLFAALVTISFALVLLTNKTTVYLSFGGLVLAATYPYMKRHTYLPQVVLGAAFAWAIPMAYTAETGQISDMTWLLYTATVLWTVAYDTMYAMVDRDDDIRIGIKSTAILFADADKVMIGVLQALTIVTLILAGTKSGSGAWYYAGIIVAAGLFGWQQYLIRNREKQACFNAFLNNHWVGMAVFTGIFLDRLVS
jgi:4-hydroxybenzoate polyprenyltransferase